MRLYRETGVSPIGCLGPLIIQMPILIGLFRVLIQTLFNNPEDLVNLSGKLYSWITFVPVHSAIPVNPHFLWLDLSQPDPSPIVMPVLVAVSTWVQQKNDADAVPGSASTVQPNHDAVDDAHFPGSVFAGLAQRIAPVLGGVQRHWNRNSILH
jgi:hypothetical protein